ncbi:Long-chain-fatty-acid--AMP ligase FadD29 [Enhygromyxa salina]|uniref:Long-chain-fatty-acid--AMP ligase FadD29 n=1 Tax=Enhygromyxa salina TaxID=215803 RepID=A0A2S9YLC7_9BACT|nr:fatty acyl-AMP ligase [Enhygromyxa salina]PRQ05907.1 Long-chain-fatty-acid--AMP ligase FadD29 [Enhygromyxa salina]
MEISETEGPTSLVDVLRARARAHGERPLYQQIVDQAVVATLSYAEADRRARAIAARLREHAEPGDRALLLYPFGLEYPAMFLACLYAGLVAVPAFPPDKQRAVKTMPRVSAIIRDADARLILTTAELAPTVEFARAEARDPEALKILATDELETTEADAQRWARPSGLEDLIAFLQYTSGSTGTPRGVMIGHDNLLAHQRLAHEKFAQPEGARTVSWLPFYHDMGLIGSLLYPLYHGGTTLLMSPIAFLRRPLSWLETISTFGARVSTGPNFAYDLCVERARDEDLAKLDLSSWRLTVSGAEPLRAATLERFNARFAACGFAPETFMPCFGMAEATLMVSGWPLELAPKTVWFDKRALWAGRAEPVDAQALAPSELELCARPFVSCGTPMREHQIAIVDPDTRQRQQEGREGEIWLRGPSVGRGYWGDADTTRERFAATIVGEDPAIQWFRTADTGFVVDGELFGSGRLADLIVVDGRSHQPHDIERSVAEGPDALVRECVAFVTEAEADGDRQVCLAATGRRTMAEAKRVALCEQIFARVRDEHDIELDRVILIPQRSVAKTTSGKLRRFRYRDALRDGELDILSELSPS